MTNHIYYIKSEPGKYPEAIKQGLIKALALTIGKNYRNVKLVLSQFGLLDSPPNFISQALDGMLPGQGAALTARLKKNRAISLVDLPQKGEFIGINAVSVRNEFPLQNQNTVALLLWADSDSLKSLTSQLAFTSVDIVAVVFNEEQVLNEMLAATKSENIAGVLDPNITSYSDQLNDEQRQALQRMKDINVTSPNTHVPTRERMKSVIDELKQKQLQVSYSQFLGYLVNEVNFPVNESVDLLIWQHSYFGR
jgi:hypothetical protein